MAKYHWRPTQIELQSSWRRTLGIWLLTIALAVGADWVVLDALRLSLPFAYVVGMGVGVILGGMGVGLLAVVFALLSRLLRPAVNGSRYVIAGLALMLGGVSRTAAEFKILASLHLVLNGANIMILGFGVLMGLLLQLVVFTLFLATYDAVAWGGIWVWNRFIVSDTSPMNPKGDNATHNGFFKGSM